MAVQQDMARQIESQIQVWQAQIKEHQERMGQAGAQVKAGYDKALEQLRANVEEASKLLRQVQDANEAAWKDMQTASLDSLERLQKGWADALRRFV
jgi:DNA mismatch repair ATPase MutS